MSRGRSVDSAASCRSLLAAASTTVVPSTPASMSRMAKAGSQLQFAIAREKFPCRATLWRARPNRRRADADGGAGGCAGGRCHCGDRDPAPCPCASGLQTKPLLQLPQIGQERDHGGRRREELRRAEGPTSNSRPISRIGRSLSKQKTDRVASAISERSASGRPRRAASVWLRRTASMMWALEQSMSLSRRRRATRVIQDSMTPWLVPPEMVVPAGRLHAGAVAAGKGETVVGPGNPRRGGGHFGRPLSRRLVIFFLDGFDIQGRSMPGPADDGDACKPSRQERRE